MPHTDEMHLYDVDDEDDGYDRPRRNEPRNEPRIENCLIEVPLDNQLGRLGLTATGDVAGIEFDDRALRAMRSARVGEHLVAAYRAAMAQARQRIIDDHHDKSGRRVAP